MAPDTWELVEVRLAVAAAVSVTPEAHRHRRHRLGDDELPLLAHHRPALLVEGGHRGTEAAAAQLALPDRYERRAAHEGAAHVGAARDRLQRRPRHVFMHPAEALGRQRRARGADPPQPRQVRLLGRLDPRLAAGEQERRRAAEERGARLTDQAPQREKVRVAGISVDQHDRRSDSQARHEVVPHHPAGRRVPAEAVGRPEVVVEGQDLEVLEQDAAVAVHDGLGQTGRARRVEDVERVVEAHLLEGERARLAHQVVPRQGARHTIGGGVEIGHDDGRGHAGEADADLRHLLGAVDGLGAVAVAVDDEQHGRLDLRKAVDHAARAELGRARRPDRADAGGRQERHDGLGDVGQVSGDPVALPHAQAEQSGTGAGHLVTQRTPCEL